VLRKIFGTKRDELTGAWRLFHNEKIYYLCSLPNIIRAIKLRKRKWAGYLASMEENRIAYRVLVGKLE
jgi:hypothetical protein